MKKIEGLILRSIDYGETSKIVYLLSNGKTESILVKGVKKTNSKYKGMILNYNYVSCYVTDSNLPTVTDMDLVYELNNIKSQLEKNRCAGLIIKVFNQTKYDDSRIYDLLLKTLLFVDKDDELYYLLAFLIKNTYFLGISPRFNCYCGDNKKQIGFSIKEGTIVCENCGLQADIDIETTYDLNQIFFSKLEEKIETNKDKLFQFVKKYYQYHASIAL